MPHTLPARHAAALAIARTAGALMRARFLDRDNLTFQLKGPQDYLTEVDGEVEHLVIDTLAQQFAEDAFLGEEGGAKGAADAPGIWVIDPIDGTSNFARGIPHFCISIAFVLNGQIEIGVIFDPMMDEMFAGQRGAGAFLNGKRMAVSKTAEFKSSLVEIGWNNRRGGLPAFMRITGALLEAGAGMIRSGSGAIGIAYVAAGRTDGYCEEHMNSWDCLAGILLVEEAGGRVNDFLKQDGLNKGNPVAVANPAIAAALETACGIKMVQEN